MKTYVGTKIIQAEPMDERTFCEKHDRKSTCDGATTPGYKVVYPDGYTSWSPKETFEAAYREISLKEKALIA